MGGAGRSVVVRVVVRVEKKVGDWVVGVVVKMRDVLFVVRVGFWGVIIVELRMMEGVMVE